MPSLLYLVFSPLSTSLTTTTTTTTNIIYLTVEFREHPTPSMLEKKHTGMVVSTVALHFRAQAIFPTSCDFV